MHGLILQSPGSVIFHLGPVVVRWYGLMFALAFVCVIFVATRLGRQFDIKDEDMINCALTNFVGGVVGARLYFVALKWDTFKDHLDQIGQTWLGGLSIHGGVIGACIFSAVFCWRRKIPYLTMCDILATAMPLAQAVGRWGNFFNSELFGLPVSADFPIKVFIPLNMRPDNAKNFEYFHATFLYESVWDLLLFFFLYFYVIRRFKHIPFFTSLVYVGGYNIGRLLIEPLRMDSIMVGTIQAPMIAGVICVVASALGLAFLLIREKMAAKKSANS
jgi:phosphatidylglycerol---prolipoprotein diacylglyceryl transferase